MLLAQVVETSREVAGTSKRLAKIDAMARLLRQVQPAEAAIAVAYLSGEMPQGRIGIGYATMRDAMGGASEGTPLELVEVDRIFTELKEISGPGSEAKRRELLRSLFGRATAEQQNFLAGLLVGELRQGALEGIMLEALAKATDAGVELIRRAAMNGGGSFAIARAAIEQGERGLREFDIQLFRPVQPMLAQTAEDIAEALGELGEAALEYKFDGARIQAHKSGERVALYSRGSNDVSAAVPEIVQAVRALPAKELILDGEVLSLDTTGRPQPFQVSMRRFGRKVNAGELQNELPMTPYWFDLLYADGGSIVDETQATRFRQLESIVPHEQLVPHLATESAQSAAEFLAGALERGHEGVMAKARSAPYAAGARGQSWLKIKQARTLDLVILAAEWGNGRRQGWLSNLHLGAKDVDKGGFAMLGKTFKGLTDEMLRWQTEELLKLEIGRDAYAVHVQPKLVAEIAFNEIQISSRYRSGLALRFARVKRYRTDKSAEESDTYQTVRRMAGLVN